MNPGTIPGKTDQGRREISERSGSLSAVQRRLLILVDGKKTVNDLLAFVRVGELDDALEFLLVQGLIAVTGEPVPLEPAVGAGFAAPSPADAVRPATSPREFAALRAQASDFVRERLGSSGGPICAAIERCDNPQELRKLLRGIEVFVGQRLGADTTQAFARHFGALLL